MASNEKRVTLEILPHLETQQGKHLLSEVFSSTKFEIFLKNTSTATSYIECGGFRKCFILLKNLGRQKL